MIKHIIRFLLLSLVAWHLWSLTYSPLPWFDETFFASITNSFMNGRGLMLEVCPIQTGNHEVLTYGPIYFLLTSLSSSLIGFGLYSIRIVNLLFAIISVTIFYKLIRRIGLSKKLTVIFLLLLSFDTIFVQNAHSGRMDLVALCFFLSAIYFHSSIKNKLYATIALSVFGTLAVLTTLRIAIFVLPVFTLLWSKLIYEKEWRSVATLPSLSLILYAIWILVGFGSVNSFISHYTQVNPDTDSSLTTSFLGGNLYVPFYQLPLVITGIVSVVLLFIKNRKSTLVWCYILPVVFFYLFISDTGAYSAMVVPFWYILIALSIKEIQSIKIKKVQSQSLISLTLMGLLFINVGVFSFKSFAILSSINERDPKPLNQWVISNLPKGSKVVGDDRYYYAAINNECAYQYIDRVKSASERAKFHYDTFEPKYLFVSKQTPQENINAYREYYYFKDTINYSIPDKSAVASKIFSLISIPISSSYEGYLIMLEPKTDIVLSDDK